MGKKLTVVLKLDEDTKTRLKEDPKKHFRSTTMHIQAIIAKHLRDQEKINPSYSETDQRYDMDNL